MNSSSHWYPATDPYRPWQAPQVSSSPPSVFGYPLNSSPLSYSPAFPRPSQPDPEPPVTTEPPRLSSPRLFLDFFPDTMPADGPGHNSATSQRHNDPPNGQDFARAIDNANRAVQDFQAALQPGSGITQNQSPFVDLTQTSPVRTSQPHLTHDDNHLPEYLTRQAIRAPSLSFGPSLGQRADLYGVSRPNFTQYLRETENLMENRRVLIGQQNRTFPPRFGTGSGVADELAISRQRDNHAVWARTQAATRRHQQSTSSDRQDTMSDPVEPSSDPPRPPPSIRKHSTTTSTSSAIEAVDLTNIEDDSDLAATLSQQRQDAILAQSSQASASSSSSQPSRSALTAYKCPICMENIRNATTTICGHLFCHSCIMETLKWSEDQRRAETGSTRKVKGVCPVCRKPLDRNDQPGVRRSLVPLELKLMTKKRKRGDKGKQKLEDVDEDDDNAGIEVVEEIQPGKGKQRKRESTEEALWNAFITE